MSVDAPLRCHAQVTFLKNLNSANQLVSSGFNQSHVLMSRSVCASFKENPTGARFLSGQHVSFSFFQKLQLLQIFQKRKTEAN